MAVIIVKVIVLTTMLVSFADAGVTRYPPWRDPIVTPSNRVETFKLKVDPWRPDKYHVEYESYPEDPRIFASFKQPARQWPNENAYYYYIPSFLKVFCRMFIYDNNNIIINRQAQRDSLEFFKSIGYNDFNYNTLFTDSFWDNLYNEIHSKGTTALPEVNSVTETVKPKITDKPLATNAPVTTERDMTTAEIPEVQNRFDVSSAVVASLLGKK